MRPLLTAAAGRLPGPFPVGRICSATVTRSRRWLSQGLLSELEAWRTATLKRTDTAHDLVTASSLRKLAVTIDSAALPTFNTPDAIVPPNWHHVYFPDLETEADLAPDGYDAIYAPPARLPNRMWAGGRLEWNLHNPLRVGQDVQQVTACTDIQAKDSARVGSLVQVTLSKTISNAGGWALTDHRSLVYMKQDGPRRTPLRRTIEFKKRSDFEATIHPTEIMLFRYSALTFNSHRIHYDWPYATGTEGHASCLVHGPLTCTLLLDLTRRHFPADTRPLFRTFTYRALSPLFCGEPFTVAGRWVRGQPAAGSESAPITGCELWAKNEDGGLAMSGTLEFA
ncbi:hypothetical protein IWQ60_006644 [Tieghemiomyces parasiticus]|uniref:N-terminal of MaoC-like dehydratase domain-containing protein n=1 Tax=Tieghemiomyces parasiticus TaxID=78921 RepID=A0A9W8A458_9FUNG|nr:hypothetical protein IWQ60_006644 [Tieghemiomyces parasiticus]